MQTKLPIHRLATLTAIACLAGSMSVAKAQTTYLWNVATPGVNNWNVPGNWNVPNYPGFGGSTADTAVFGATGTSASSTSLNNEVSVNTTLAALNYTNTGSGAWHVTDIAAGVTLKATNVTMGGVSGNFITDVAMLDAGTFVINGNWSIGNLPSANQICVVDLSGLSNLVYNASSGTINIGPANDSIANVSLAAASNNVTAGTFNYNINDTSSSSTTTFTLGAGTNIFNVGTFDMAYGRNTTTVSFPAGSTAAGLRMRGVGGTDTSLGNMTLGYHNTSGSGSHATATLSLNGFPVDIRLATLILGRSDHTPTVNSPGTGTISFDTGTMFVSNCLMAITVGAVASGSTDFAQGIGAINVGANGKLFIGPGGMSLVDQTNNATASVASTGSLTLNGGTAICSNSIVKTSTVGVGTVTNNNGTLTMVTGTIGTTANPIDVLNLNGGTVHLNVNGSAVGANINASATYASGATITIDSVANVSGLATIHLIGYTPANGDPYSGITLGPVPAGYTASLVDNSGAGFVDLSLSPAGVVVKSLLWKGAVGSTLNSSWDFTTANWLNTNGTANTYTNPDLVTFDDTASNSTVTLAIPLAPGTLTFSNSGAINAGLDYTLNGSGSITGAVGLVKSLNQITGQAGTVTLAETGGDSFSGGISVNAGTLILNDANSAISGNLGIASGATLQIGNNNANGNLPSGTLTVNGTLEFDQSTTSTVSNAIAGTGALIQAGSGKVTLSAVNGYTGNTYVTGGTLALTTVGAISNSTAVTANGATLDLSGAPGSVLNTLNISNAIMNVAVNNSLQPVNVINGLAMIGTANTINVTALPAVASYPVTFILVHAVGGITGFNMGLAPLPGGSTGSVSESADSTSVLLTLTSGPVGTRTTVLWVGTNSASVTTNWSDRLNWFLPGAPATADNVFFSDSGTGSSGTPFSAVGDGVGGLANAANINNVVDTSFTVGTLTYTNVGGTAFAQNTLIANGASLTVVSNGSLTVGSGSVDLGSGATVLVTIAGMKSTLNVNDTNGTFLVGLGNAGSGTEQATLDLSGLGTFNADVSTFFVGVGSGSEGIALGRASGIIYLAQTNNITAAIAVTNSETSDTAASAVALDVGDDDGNPGLANFLYLGQTNAIFADGIGVGRQKPTATMEFNPNSVNIGAGPSAWFRGASTNAVSVWSVGDEVGNSGSGENANGTCDFSGGQVNALVGTMYVGRVSSSASGAGTATGMLTYDDGVFSIGTLYDGYQPSTGLKTANGTVNVNSNATLGAGATLFVSGNLNLGLTTGGTAASGTLSINNGTAALNNVVCGTSGGISTISLSGGTLIVSNSLGTPAAPLTTLNLGGGTLQLNVAGNSSTDVVATTVSPTAATTINIGSLTGLTGPAPVQVPLISYTGTDPFSSLSLGTLPAGSAGILVDDTAKSTIDINFTTIPPSSPPRFTGISVSGITLTLTATNGAHGGQFVLLGTTNLTTPLNQWTPLLTNNFNGSGNLNLSTNIINPAVPQQFYILLQ